jgi:hypothetical protein
MAFTPTWTTDKLPFAAFHSTKGRKRQGYTRPFAQRKATHCKQPDIQQVTHACERVRNGLAKAHGGAWFDAFFDFL